MRACQRTEAESRELAVLEWSAEFTDDAVARAGEMATPWFGIGYECSAAIKDASEFATVLLEYLAHQAGECTGNPIA